MQIKNINDLATKIYHIEKPKYVTEELLSYQKGMIKRDVYKYTNCGAWINFTNTGIELGSIVEGVDWGTNMHTLEYPFTKKQYWDTLQSIEDQANEIWQDTHGCDSCPENTDTGMYTIDPNCPNCKGEGLIL